MLRTNDYTFTGFHKSGNPFLWYYDENKHTLFTTSVHVATWDKQPVIGDKITIIDNEYGDVQEVFINGELVYKHSPEKEKEFQALNDKINQPIIDAAMRKFKN